MRSTVMTLPALSFALLSGCAVGPDYHRPQPSSPSHFMGEAAVSQRVATSEADLSRWWKGFGDPLLDRLVQDALDKNLDLAQAVARISQSGAGLDAATAALFPSASLQGSGGRIRSSQRAGLGAVVSSVGGDRDFSSYEGNLAASWELDVFGGLGHGREAALADYQSSQAGAVAARLSVTAGVADTYIVIRGLQARLAVAREQAGTQRKLVELIRLQYQNGVAAELQLHQVEGVLSQIEGSIPVLQSGLDSALNAMDVLLGSQPGTYRAMLQTIAPIPQAPSIAEAGGPADLLRRRPDLIVAERRLAASNARIGQSMAEYYPKFSLFGLLGTASTMGTGSLFSPGATQAQGIFGFRWRLFDFGRVDAEIKAAKSANAEALAAYRLAVLRASEDVENAFSALINSEDQERTLAGGEGSFRRARGSSEAAYKSGAISLIEVLDAEIRLLQTRDARIQAQTGSARAAVASFRALGGGWDAPL